MYGLFPPGRQPDLGLEGLIARLFHPYPVLPGIHAMDLGARRAYQSIIDIDTVPRDIRTHHQPGRLRCQQGLDRPLFPRRQLDTAFEWVMAGPFHPHSIEAGGQGMLRTR